MFEKAEKAFLKIIEGILAAAFAVMIVVVLLQVIARYFLPASMAWTDELVRMLLVYVTFLGTVVLYAERGHIAVTNFIDMAGEKVRRIMLVICYIMQIAFCIIVFYAGIQYLSLVQARSTVVLHMSLTVCYVIIPVTSLMTLVFVIRDFVLEGIKGQKFEAESEIVKAALEEAGEREVKE